MKKVIIAFTCKVMDIMSSWVFFFWNRLIVIIDSKCAIIWTGAILRSLINDVLQNLKNKGLSLWRILVWDVFILDCSCCVGRRTFIPITEHYDKKYSSWVLAKRLVLKIMLYHLAILLHDFVMMLHLFVISFECILIYQGLLS